jgi:hypothetical protein
MPLSSAPLLTKSGKKVRRKPGINSEDTVTWPELAIAFVALKMNRKQVLKDYRTILRYLRKWPSTRQHDSSARIHVIQQVGS